MSQSSIAIFISFIFLLSNYHPPNIYIGVGITTSVYNYLLCYIHTGEKNDKTLQKGENASQIPNIL